MNDADAQRLIFKLITDGFAYEKIKEFKFVRNYKTLAEYIMLSDEREKFFNI